MVTSCHRDPVWSDGHFTLLLFRGATWSSRGLWADCKVWEMRLCWFASGSQVYRVIERHTLKAVVGQPSPHIKILNSKVGNGYGLPEKKRQSSLIRNKNLESVFHFIRLCNFNQSLRHIERRLMGGRLSHIGPRECSYTFSETPTLWHPKEDAKLWSQKTRTSLSFCVF